MLIHAIRVLLPVMGVFCLTGNMLSGGEYKPDFFRGVNAGQKFRCEAKADYLAEHYLRGSIESAKTTFKNIRILCFFDKGDLVVLTNCFLKKSQKTPAKEIKLAEKLKREYLIEKYKEEHEEFN